MKATPELIERLNDALAREMRAQTMYAHYAAYVKGIHRLHLKPFFETEAAEFMVSEFEIRYFGRFRQYERRRGLRCRCRMVAAGDK